MPTTPDGRLLPVHETHLFVTEVGPADALPVLVVGPAELDSLADRYRLVSIDLRGQGRSDSDTDPASWTLSQHASDVSAVAAALGVERYAVVGSGPGAAVALQHAADAPGAAVATVVTEATGELPQVPQPLIVAEPTELAQRVADVLSGIG
jgi:pimeloyl-ACP methyl ester carboxylesterase